MKRVFCIMVVLSVLSLLSCRAVVPNYFAFREKAFSAELVGELAGVAFSARVRYDGAGARTVEYLGEGSLGGLVARAYPDGQVQLLRGEMQIGGEATPFAGLLSPIDALLSDTEVEAVKKGGEQTILTLGEERRLTLDGDGIPCAFSSTNLHFTVMRWECGDTSASASFSVFERGGADVFSKETAEVERIVKSDARRNA